MSPSLLCFALVIALWALIDSMSRTVSRAWALRPWSTGDLLLIGVGLAIDGVALLILAFFFVGLAS